MFGTATTGTSHDIQAIPGLWRDAHGEAAALSSRGRDHAALRLAMLKDRKIVLMDRLGWDLQSPDGLHELDEYDDEETLYLIVHQPETGRHLGSVRLLPSTGAHLLGDKFAHLWATSSRICAPMVCRWAPMCGRSPGWSLRLVCRGPRHFRCADNWQLPC